MCFLVSGLASEKATWDGTNITLQVKRESVGQEFESCSDLIDATCFVKTGVST